MQIESVSNVQKVTTDKVGKEVFATGPTKTTITMFSWEPRYYEILELACKAQEEANDSPISL